MLFKCISISVSLDMLTGMGGLRVGGGGWLGVAGVETCEGN